MPIFGMTSRRYRPTCAHAPINLKVTRNILALQFKKLGDRKGQEIRSARVTLKHRALAVKLPDEYLR